MSAPGTPAGGRRLAGRVVLVTGAYGGYGRALAVDCARAGARLVLLGRNARKLERAADAVEQAGGEALLYPLDLEGATPDDYAELAARVGEGAGRLDALVHCAAHFPGLTPLEHSDPAAFARALHVGLTARWWLTQACLPLLRDSGAGRVVFAVDPGPRAFPAYWGGYGVAQRGLEALVETLAAEQPGLAVHALHLPPLRTPLRARAYAADEDRLARDPAGFTGPCLDLLAGGGEGA
ncbi:SDR family NAD(P)-dependent oxidoreductase [Luteimonas wenzhouensis]|uniref:SDR family NAD(P)-dependent oxidoreductase n=1 Tax=Luteimonas wenzhouensis TaxID=2599615 RepID=UPI001FEBB733|nr:SDR family NAD(P)-dependent oxidoreductase [Luteimonas wenzhouensis]